MEWDTMVELWIWMRNLNRKWRTLTWETCSREGLLPSNWPGQATGDGIQASKEEPDVRWKWSRRQIRSSRRGSMFPRRISLGAICFLRESRGILLESLEDLVKVQWLSNSVQMKSQKFSINFSQAPFSFSPRLQYFWVFNPVISFQEVY